MYSSLLLLFSLLHLTAALSPLRLNQHPPQKFIQVTRPLPFDSQTPACTLSVLSHTFAHTVELPPTVATYSPPPACDWSHAVLHLSAAANASQQDRIAAIWLSGSEILRTTTPKPTPDGISWSVRKDVSRYSFLLRQNSVNMTVMLENAVDDVYTGSYSLNLTFFYYRDRNGKGKGNVPLSMFPVDGDDSPGMQLKDSFNLDQNPADMIVPISASGDEGFWFKIQSEYDTVYQRIQIPANTFKAVIEIYVSFHENDEFWYANPPDSYIKMNNLDTEKGNGAYREILVKIDDNVVGSVIPFPVISAGGINPFFWKPVVSIGAFDLPSYEIELTPFLGILHDGEEHSLALGVSDAISYWLIDANLHLWLDSKVAKVQAGVIRYRNPSTQVQRRSKFRQLDGRFQTTGKREGQFSGWVKSSAGNLITEVVQKFSVENTVEFDKNGSEKTVNQKVEFRTQVKVTANRRRISDISMERKDNLKMKTNSLSGGLMMTELENGMRDTKEDKSARSRFTLENTQECSGWVVRRDEEVIAGSATTNQDYEEKDRSNCYRRLVSAEGGSIKNDNTVPCAKAAEL